MLKKLGAATAVLALIAGAVTFTQTFVTRDVMASEHQQMQMKMDLRFLEQRKDALFDRHLQLKTLMLEQPQHRAEIIRELNKVEAEREAVDGQILDLLRGNNK
jgi:hypothetical protein